MPARYPTSDIGRLGPGARAQIAAQGVLAGPTRRLHKYNAVATVVDGIHFDSKREADRWCDLIVMQRAGVIADLKRQVPFPLVVKDKLVRTYVADFRYRVVATGKTVVEDVKGFKTREYRMKRDLMLACYGIVINEVK